MTLLNTKEAADYLKIAKRTIYNWTCQGKIKYIKLGGLKFRKDDLDALIEGKGKKNGGLPH